MAETTLSREPGRFWCSALFSLIGEVAKEKNWYEATDMGIGIVREAFVKEATKIAKDQNLKSDEPSETKKIFEGFATSLMPGWKWSEKTSGDTLQLDQVGDCLMWKAAKEIGVQDNLRVHSICEAACTGLVQVVGQNLIVIIDRAMCKGDEHCEFTVSRLEKEELM